MFTGERNMNVPAGLNCRRLVLNSFVFMATGTICLIAFFLLIPESPESVRMLDIVTAVPFLLASPFLPITHGAASSDWWMRGNILIGWMLVLCALFFAQLFSRHAVATYLSITAIILWWITGTLCAIVFAIAAV